jgi:glycosyltransferase involved in cell wall biosynthesis
MRIIIAHNRYKFAGGEDSVAAAEMEMLRRGGHEIELLEADNRAIEGTLAKIAAAGSLFHSPSSSRRMAELLNKFQPDIVHVHNWFPLLSPSIISVAYAAGVPVVQTLHNYRMICANAGLYRDGSICLDCVGKALPLNGVMHGCYYDSRLGSALVTTAFSYHDLAGTWDGVTKFVAVSEFQRELLFLGGMEPSRITVKPNFVRDPGTPGDGSGGHALFVGRMTAQKGIRTVMKAWDEHRLEIPLKIMGDGPLADEIRTRAAQMGQVEYLGLQSSSEVAAAMRDARFLIFASESYETFALAVVEAFSHGTPVLAANIEPIAAIVRDGVTGLRFDVGDASGLAEKAKQLFAGTPGYREMRHNCRRLYEDHYTESRNYEMLTSIYAEAIASKRGGAKALPAKSSSSLQNAYGHA